MIDAPQTPGHPELPVKPSDTQPRTCPQCGGKVSSRARTCLICGADLTAPVPTLEPQPTPPSRPRLNLKNLLLQILSSLIGLVLLAGMVWGFMTLVRRASRPALSPTPIQEMLPTSSPTIAATDTPIPTATAGPTATPLPPIQHTVKAGETLSGIAVQYQVTVQDIQLLNNLGNEDIIRVGQVLLIPPRGATPIPPTSPPAGPTAGTIIHVVQSGETLLGIAQRYGVPMSTIQNLNNIADPERLQVGQQLIIPVNATSAPPTAYLTPTPSTAYPSPPLLAPLDGTKFEGADTPILLQWAATTLLRSDEWYLVTLDRPGSGQPPVTFKTKTTALYVPVELYPPAQDTQRLFRWRVSIVRQIDESPAYEDLSRPGEIRTFLWLWPASTPTPTPGPT